MEVKLPPKFYHDHVQRDLPGGTVVKENSRHVWVELNRDDAEELLSDAEHYANPVNGYTSDYPGLAASARATAKKLRRKL
jgi:hypothetical protein